MEPPASLRPVLFAFVSAICLAPAPTAAEPRCLGDDDLWDRSTPVEGSSALCLGCHDGTVARAVSHDQIGPGGSDSHPIGVSYFAAQARRRTALRSLGEIAPQLILPDGRVECVTCHDATSRRPSLLAMTNQGSALCFGCHRL